MKKLYYIETHIVDHCNLNCKYCSHYSPLAKPFFKDINEYIKEIARLSEIGANKIETIRIMGGEPLLHPDILKFCYITRKAFPHSHIVIVTNGILLIQQDKDFFNKLNKWNIEIYLSNYGIIKEEYLTSLKNKINSFYIGERINQMSKFAFDLTGKNNKEKIFLQCQKEDYNCITLKNGKLYHCPTIAHLNSFLNYFDIEIKNFNLENEGINIYNFTLEEIEKFLFTPRDFCKYCKIETRNSNLPFQISEKKISEWLD